MSGRKVQDGGRGAGGGGSRVGGGWGSWGAEESGGGVEATGEAPLHRATGGPLLEVTPKVDPLEGSGVRGLLHVNTPHTQLPILQGCNIKLI